MGEPCSENVKYHDAPKEGICSYRQQNFNYEIELKIS